MEGRRITTNDIIAIICFRVPKGTSTYDIALLLYSLDPMHAALLCKPRANLSLLSSILEYLCTDTPNKKGGNMAVVVTDSAEGSPELFLRKIFAQGIISSTSQ